MSGPNPECPGCQMLLARVEQLTARVAELEARLPKHSGNSSKPPASDHPHDPHAPAGKAGRAGRDGDPASKDPAEKRKRGGQKGHPGTTRALLPTEAVQEVVSCLPLSCAHCPGSLAGVPADPSVSPRREQVWELPPLRWEVTEYQRYACTCPDCGQRTWGERPPDAPVGALGFRAQAAVGVLTGGAQLTRRTALTLLRELLGGEVSLGTLSRVEGTLCAALEPAVKEVAAAVGNAPIVQCDETPWREAGAKPWLWVATTPEATLFRIDLHRDTAAFEKLLPAREGQIKLTDRYSVYVHHIPEAEHAVCWAHLMRDFAAWEERPNVAGKIARWLSEEAGRLFSHWHAFQRGAIDRATLCARMVPVQRAMKTALAWGAATGIPQFKGLCANLLARWDPLWTFTRVEGVEPTNNAAERAVRPGVLWRKTSLFSQSERGRIYVASMLTVKTTLRQRGGNLLEFLTESLRAAQTGGEPPSVFAAALG